MEILAGPRHLRRRSAAAQHRRRRPAQGPRDHARDPLRRGPLAFPRPLLRRLERGGVAAAGRRARSPPLQGAEKLSRRRPAKIYACPARARLPILARRRNAPNGKRNDAANTAEWRDALSPASCVRSLWQRASRPRCIAQEGGGAEPTPVAAAKKPVKKKAVKPAGPPAKELFGAAKTPAPMAARAIGFYAKGCLAGAAALPIDGPAWQAMRLSRNRNWGHPKLVALVEKLARRGQRARRLAGPSGRRPLPAARRADADAGTPATRSGSMPTSGSPPCPTGV